MLRRRYGWDGIYRNEYFYGGNLQGIKEKLPYIKELGFNAIYMNPICKSRNYHHYEAESFWQIDPMLGDWKDLEELCTEAEKMGVTNKSISRWENGKTMPDISMLGILSSELNCTIPELLNGKKMTKEELIDLRETINNLIEYESNQQIKNDKKFNKYNMIGCIALVLALLDTEFQFLDYIFTPNAREFVQGLLYGICILANMISLYNRSHNISICEKKKELIKK